MPEQADEKTRGSRELFGRLAVAMGLVNPQQVADCLDLQRRLAQGGRSIPLGKIMLAKGYMTAFQIDEVLKSQGARAVRCISCSAEFAIGESVREGFGPVRCPQCLRRLSDFFPSEIAPASAVAEGLGPAKPEVTQEIAAPPPPGPGCALRVEPVDGPPADVDVPLGGRIVIGRGAGEGAAQSTAPVGAAGEAGPGLTIRDPGLSRRHCAVANETGRLFVEDLGSRNGTFVNGERLDRRRRLRPGDEIAIGGSRMLVLAPRAAEPTPDNTTDIWRAEGLCMLCGMVIPAEHLERGRAQRAEKGFLCERCLEVALVPGRMLGGYRILEQIGIGGMAEVYRVEQASSGRLLALKTLLHAHGASEAARRRFVQEARAAGRLEHPNLVRIYDAGEDCSIPYIVMEFVEGEDLADLLDRQGLLGVDRSIDVALDIASALGYAHAHNVIHRDVKPANILLDRTYGRARLLDLGVAKIHDLDAEARLTRTGVGLGTLEYAAPEQIESAKHVDGRADVYSLGATLYRCVVGRRPFAAARELDLARSIIQDPLVWPEEAKERAPRGLRKAVERAMAKRPDHRYPTAEDFRAALAKVREALD